MANNIDLTEDPRYDMAIASQIGSAIGMSLAERRRREGEKMLVGQLRTFAAGKPDESEYTNDEMLDTLTSNSKILDTRMGQEWVRELTLAKMKLGRYHQDPLTRQYLQSRIDATDALTESRTQGGLTVAEKAKLRDQEIELQQHRLGVQKQLDAEPENETLKIRLGYLDNAIAEIYGQLGYTKPPPSRASVDAVTGDFATIPGQRKPSEVPKESAADKVIKKVKGAGGAVTDIANQVAASGPIRPPTATLAEGWDERVMKAKPSVPQGQFMPGDTVEQNGKRYRIISVKPDGKLEAEEID